MMSGSMPTSNSCWVIVSWPGGCPVVHDDERADVGRFEPFGDLAGGRVDSDCRHRLGHDLTDGERDEHLVSVWSAVQHKTIGWR